MKTEIKFKLKVYCNYLYIYSYFVNLYKDLLWLQDLLPVWLLLHVLVYPFPASAVAWSPVVRACS